MNKVLLIGRLTADPKVEYTNNAQTARAKFCLAVDRGKDRNGEMQTDFPLITAWGKTAEIVDKYVHKGNRIAVEGKIITGSYEKDGRKIYTTDIYAERVEFLESRRDDDSSEVKAEPKQESFLPNQGQKQNTSPFAWATQIDDSDIPF